MRIQNSTTGICTRIKIHFTWLICRQYLQKALNAYKLISLILFTVEITLKLVPWFTNGINLFWLVFTAALIAREYTSIEQRGNVLNSVHYVGYKLVIWYYLIRGRNYFIQGRGGGANIKNAFSPSQVISSTSCEIVCLFNVSIKLFSGTKTTCRSF